MPWPGDDLKTMKLVAGMFGIGVSLEFRLDLICENPSFIVFLLFLAVVWKCSKPKVNTITSSAGRQ